MSLSQKKSEYDIAIIGGGAAGLAAGIAAGRAGVSAVILERLPRVGKKLLSTGNGRCNFTNLRISEEKYRGSCARLLPPPERFGAESFMKSIGVFSAADNEGRVYPLSGSASSVLDGLRLEAKKLGVRELCDSPVEKIIPGKKFTLASGSERITAKAVILAGGGLSQKALGSDGSAVRLARSLGIATAPMFPALVPLKTAPEAVKGLKGVRAAALAKLVKNGRTVKAERGEVQFGDNTLSGICVFNLSLWYDEGENAGIALDFLPDMEPDELSGALFFLRESRKDAPPEELLTGLLHKRIGLLIMRELVKKPVAQLTGSDLDRLARDIKNARFPILGTAGFEKSQVTRGGVLADELDGGFQALKIPRLFVCGEMLDVAGECGGYNLTFAFASGYAAGENAAKEVKKLK